MPQFTNKEIISSIQNDDEQVLLYLSKKYFESSRRAIRRAGFPDSSTPEIFSSTLVKTCREIQHNRLTGNVDFEQFYYNVLNEEISLLKEAGIGEINMPVDKDVKVSAHCFSVLDDAARKIIAARFVEKLSFEQIASRFNFSNPVIAQFEFNKAYRQFETIVRARFNKSLS